MNIVGNKKEERDCKLEELDTSPGETVIENLKVCKEKESMAKVTELEVKVVNWDLIF